MASWSISIRTAGTTAALLAFQPAIAQETVRPIAYGQTLSSVLDADDYVTADRAYFYERYLFSGRAGDEV